MRAFIVRPFGIKEGIDFDRVEIDLIAPALNRAAITGTTTGEIVEAGNIRVDMFEQLLIADLVIADVSIHNANVFYELGIRHALRGRQTILIRSNATQSEAPFDIRTDRYMTYNAANPAASIDALLNVIGQTRTGERVDSPVFLSLPELVEQDRTKLTPLPREFPEEVARASASRRVGLLGLLGWEAHGFAWETEGRRLVGRELFRLRAFPQARDTWQEIRNFEPLDREANLMLGTVLQRLGDLTASDQALDRALKHPACTRTERAEAYALLARNDKSRWQVAWAQAESGERRRLALRSRFLMDSYDRYRSAFAQDLNHYYSGLNALSLLTLAMEMIKAEPDTWDARFDSDADAEAEQRKLERLRADLVGAVGMALEGARSQLPAGASDIWLDISFADYKFLTLQRTPAVVLAYESALAGAASFHIDSARSQLQLFDTLGVLSERVRACLAVFPVIPTRVEKTSPVIERTIVFTGHMIDAPGRRQKRFPPEAEPLARDAIRKALVEVAGSAPERTVGVAGAASGGDILFLELCAELGIRTRIRLALPPPLFLARSVSPAGQNWVDRFNKLVKSEDAEVLAESESLPRWLQRKGGYDIWQRNNIWLLHEALAISAPDTVLIALWDGNPGDGPGGTNHMVSMAEERGVRTITLDTGNMLNLSAAPSQ